MKKFFLLCALCLIGLSSCASTPKVEPTGTQEIILYNDCPWAMEGSISFDKKSGIKGYKTAFIVVGFPITVYRGIKNTITFKGAYDNQFHSFVLDDIQETETEWHIEWSTYSNKYVLSRTGYRSAFYDKFAIDPNSQD